MDKCNENASFLFYLNSMNKHALLLNFYQEILIYFPLFVSVAVTVI